jgi:peptidoglycan LD-endopeptidase LytH
VLRKANSLFRWKRFGCQLGLTALLTACSLNTASLPATPTLLPPTLLPTISPTQTFIPTSTQTPVPPLPTPTNTLVVKSPTPSSTPTPDRAYVFPIQPPEVASYQRGHHDYPATDIFAPIGSSVVAVTNGIVDFVSYEDRWDGKVDDPATRGGLSVAIIGDDGVRYYGSHLSAIAPGIMPGVRVRAGKLLGYSGRTGNARGTSPHLHFGISHPTYPEDWEVRRGEISPYPYLQAWERGEMLVPVLK